MQIRFWGTRGSIAKPGPGTVRYGGNTPCVEVRTAGGTLLVLDSGTGAHALGQALLSSGNGPTRGHLLLTHTHWDHIQGLPFFAPLFAPGHEWDIYGPRGISQSLREVLAGQMQQTYFPVTLDGFAATVRYHDLVEGNFDIGDVRVTVRLMNHTALTLGYRLTGDAVVVYATDYEPHEPELALKGYTPTGGGDDDHVRFLQDADLVIHDCQYPAAEYPEKQGWGHSTVEFAVDAARAARVRRLALFHHDPDRDDDAIDRLVADARQRLGPADTTLEVFAAAEGQTIEVRGGAQAIAVEPVAAPSAAVDLAGALGDQTVLVAVRDSTVAAPLMEAARMEGLSPVLAADGAEVLHAVSCGRPSLLLLDCDLADGNAIGLCRELRGQPGEYARDVPVVLVTRSEAGIDREVGGGAGVTDWLVQPFRSAYARTWMRAWLLRSACRWQKAPLPGNEAQRLRALESTGLLESEPEERFDCYTRIAAALFRVPIALVTLVDADRQWFKSRLGMDLHETSRDLSFCAHTILDDDVLQVPDATHDPRFAENPWVNAWPRIRFYAGVRLIAADGSCIGAFCLMDHRPRQLSNAELGVLRDLAHLVEREIRV
jgi:phosphoribosyl 1,2-cyclic phosphodiesterase/GAF domain-containing protein